MANELTMFQTGAVPAHIANAFGEETNIANRQTVPSLSYEGKTWTVSVDGNKTKLIKRNEDGDEVPLSVMRVVVLDYAKRRGRTFYEGEYDPNNVGAPICWSDDGITPDAAVPDDIKENKTSFKCESCPQAVKGSKITAQGKAVTACSQHRMLAVVPANNLNFQPLRMKIAITSDFDKQSPDEEAKSWFAFSGYTDFLKSRGVNHTAQLVTKIKFDANAAYPKLFFAADRWLEANEVQKVAPLTKDPEVQKLLGGTWTPAGVDGVRTDDTTAIEKPSTAPQKASRAAATVDEDDDDSGEIVMQGMGAEPAPAVQEPAQAEVAAPKPTRSKPDPKPAARKAAEATPVASTDVPPDVAALLSDWTD
jgi:hypothetical protein